MLDAIGLDRQHTEVYRLLLGLPSADAEQVARQASLGVRDARGILDDLEALGLIARQASAPDRVVASPPSVALRPMLLERERRLTEAHEALVHLSDLYREGAAQRTAPDVVDVVLGPEAVVQRIGQLQASAEREVKEAQRVEHRLLLGAVQLEEGLAARLGGARAVRVPAHAVHDDEERGAVARGHRGAVLVVLAIAGEAHLGELERHALPGGPRTAAPC